MPLPTGTYSLIIPAGTSPQGSPGVNWQLTSIDHWRMGALAGCVDAGVYTATLAFTFFGNLWHLGGDIVGDFTFAGLPPGFTLVTADCNIGAGKSDGSGLCTMNITVAGIPFPEGVTGQSLMPITALAANNANVSIAGHTEANCSDFLTATLGGSNFAISGQWTAFQFTWTFGQDGDSVSPGDLITITSDSGDPDAMDLNHVTITLPCGVVVPVTQSQHLYTFLVPESCDGNLVTNLTATGDGTQFSGSVVLGTLTILLINGSGIYTLVTGQRHDEYYSNLRDGTTVSIKIPNPTARTGFIGG